MYVIDIAEKSMVTLWIKQWWFYWQFLFTQSDLLRVDPRFMYDPLFAVADSTSDWGSAACQAASLKDSHTGMIWSDVASG